MTPEEIRRIALYFDGLRYSLSMADIARRRLQPTLDEVARLHDANEDTEAEISSALLDAWSIIDMCHRVRELVQSTPQLPHKLLGIQVFLRATAHIEELRHYVQHFRSGIPEVPISWSPLWGSVSWVPAHDPTTCYTIFPGSLSDGLTASSISYDTHELRFTTEIILATGVATADLLSVAARMSALRTSIIEWIDQHPLFTHKDSNTLIWKVTMSPQL
jgi:hypothetical protein